MAKTRKDLRGRALRKGEVQRKSDQRYMYTYTDPLGRRKFIYANDLTELREKEQKLQRDQLDGLDLYAAGKATVNDTFAATWQRSLSCEILRGTGTFILTTILSGINSDLRSWWM